jgi:hypothetical protein
VLSLISKKGAQRVASLLTLLPTSTGGIPYFHVVFTLPSAVGDIAYQNKAVICGLLFKASSETMLRIAAEGLPRIGRISTEKRSRSCASPQSASC